MVCIAGNTISHVYSTYFVLRVVEVWEVCIFWHKGGGNIYGSTGSSLYIHGFAGMLGMCFLGGVALESEALHADLQRNTYYFILLRVLWGMFILMDGGGVLHHSCCTISCKIQQKMLLKIDIITPGFRGERRGNRCLRHKRTKLLVNNYILTKIDTVLCYFPFKDVVISVVSGFKGGKGLYRWNLLGEGG